MLYSYKLNQIIKKKKVSIENEGYQFHSLLAPSYHCEEMQGSTLVPRRYVLYNLTEEYTVGEEFLTGENEWHKYYVYRSWMDRGLHRLGGLGGKGGLASLTWGCYCQLRLEMDSFGSGSWLDEWASLKLCSTGSSSQWRGASLWAKHDVVSGWWPLQVLSTAVSKIYHPLADTDISFYREEAETKQGNYLATYNILAIA